MKAWYCILLLVVAAGLGCESVESMFDKDEAIALSKVPEPALDAAKAAVPGIVLTGAEVEEEDGQTIYDLTGMAEGKEYEIEVTAEGKVLEIEQDDDAD